MRARSCRGFTLIELLVGFAVIAALAALVPPSFENMLAGTQYRSTVQVVHAELRKARSVALANGVPVTFGVDLDKREFGLVGLTRHPVPQMITVSAQVAELASSNALAGITFLPGGGATGGTLDVRRSDGTGTRFNIDWMSGQIRMDRIAP